MYCYIDCRIDTSLDNDYLNLSIWGKYSYAYVIETIKKTNQFEKIIVITDSKKIEDYCKEFYPWVDITLLLPDRERVPFFIISGRAPLISINTICDVIMKCANIQSARFEYICDVYEKISMLGSEDIKNFNAFWFQVEQNSSHKPDQYVVPENEAVVINTINDFELVLILKKKENSKEILYKQIVNRIFEKQKILTENKIHNSICFIGHSQLDQWEISEMAGLKVVNCGISGISSFEYYDLILAKEILKCNSMIYVVMHGTNDIVYEYSMNDIITSINRTISYIRDKDKGAIIIFVECIHTNGRLDRSNEKINQLNEELKNSISNDIVWLGVDRLDNQYQELDISYTIDGLHLSNEGYDVLRNILERKIQEIMKE